MCLHYWIAPKLTLCPWAETARQIWRSEPASNIVAPHASLVRDLAVVGWLAVITAVALSRLNLPVVAGFLVAGAVFGPEGVGLITDAGEIREIADIGVVLLLFGIGLEFSLERLRYIWRSVVVGGAFQVGLTALAVFVALLLREVQKVARRRLQYDSG